MVSFWVLVAALLGLRAAGASIGWGFQLQSPVFLLLIAGLLFFLGLSLAGQFEIGLDADERRRIAGGEAGLHGQLLYRSAGGGGGHAVRCAVHGRGHWLRAVAVGCRYVCVFTALALGLAAPYVALTLQPALDALAAEAGSVDGGAAAGCLDPHLHYRDLAGLGAGAGIRRQPAGRAAGIFLLLAIAGWFLGRWPAKRWATVVARDRCGGCHRVGRGCAGRAGSGAREIGAAVTQDQWQPWSPDAVSKYQARGAAGVCGLYGELVPELPGERARGAGQA